MDDTNARAGGAVLSPPPDGLVAAATGLHRAGRLKEAAALYEQALAADRSHVAALHLLGVIRFQQGDPARAADLIGRAAKLRPGVAVIHAHLAEVSQALGRHGQAAENARAALASGPDDPGV